MTLKNGMKWTGVSVRLPAGLTLEQWYKIDAELRGHWLSMILACADRLSGGVLVGARRWSGRDWDRVTGIASRRTVDRIVAQCLAQWSGDDLVVAGYDHEGEKKYRDGVVQRTNAANSRHNADAGRTASRDADRTTGRTSDRAAPLTSHLLEVLSQDARARVDEIAETVCRMLSSKTGVSYIVSDGIRDLVLAIVLDKRQAYTLRDFKLVVWWKVKEWGDHPSLRDQLTPTTLLDARRFGERLAMAQARFDEQDTAWKALGGPDDARRGPKRADATPTPAAAPCAPDSATGGKPDVF